jgi:hypothetical protein
MSIPAFERQLLTDWMKKNKWAFISQFRPTRKTAADRPDFSGHKSKPPIQADHLSSSDHTPWLNTLFYPTGQIHRGSKSKAEFPVSGNRRLGHRHSD